MDIYRGKVALVTGASSGIGAVTAKRLVSHGLKVVAVARRIDRLKKLKVEVGETNLFPYKCDLANSNEIKSMIDWIKNTFGGLHILINNAGVMMYGHLLDQTPQDWSLMMNVNLISVSYLTQLASKLMLENPKESSNEIIFINSMAGHVENDNAMTTMYNCTKFALTTLIENWRKELLTKSDGSIRVGSISPGLVRTEIVKAAFPDQPGFSDQIYSTFPCLEAEDLADLIDYLLSNPRHIQLQDLQVTHVHSGLLNNYSEDSKSKVEIEADKEQT